MFVDVLVAGYATDMPRVGACHSSQLSGSDHSDPLSAVEQVESSGTSRTNQQRGATAPLTLLPPTVRSGLQPGLDLKLC